jgi:hypothetical protein
VNRLNSPKKYINKYFQKKTKITNNKILRTPNSTYKMGTWETLVSWLVLPLIWFLFASLFLQEVNERIAFPFNENGERNKNITSTYVDLTSVEGTIISFILLQIRTTSKNYVSHVFFKILKPNLQSLFQNGIHTVQNSHVFFYYLY